MDLGQHLSFERLPLFPTFPSHPAWLLGCCGDREEPTAPPQDILATLPAWGRRYCLACTVGGCRGKATHTIGVLFPFIPGRGPKAQCALTLPMSGDSVTAS